MHQGIKSHEKRQLFTKFASQKNTPQHFAMYNCQSHHLIILKPFYQIEL